MLLVNVKFHKKLRLQSSATANRSLHKAETTLSNTGLLLFFWLRFQRSQFTFKNLV